jgi:hypothetical protein
MLLVLTLWVIFRDDLLRLGVVGSSLCRRVGQVLLRSVILRDDTQKADILPSC